MNEDNEFITRPFAEEEILKVDMQMGKKNKAPGPDNIAAEFYLTCWGIIKDDLMKLFQDFYEHNLDISLLNYEVITLLPKIKEAEKNPTIQTHMSIECLLQNFHHSLLRLKSSKRS